MASTSLRMMRLLTLLQNHRYWPGLELAERLEVSVRTLRRDIERLRELGYPVQAQRGVNGGYQLAAGAALPPLVLDDDEAVALTLGLQAAAEAPVEGLAESSVSALAKVAQVMPPRLRRRVEALRAMTLVPAWDGGRPGVDAGTLTTVAQACRDTRNAETRGAGRWCGARRDPRHPGRPRVNPPTRRSRVSSGDGEATRMIGPGRVIDDDLLDRHGLLDRRRVHDQRGWAGGLTGDIQGVHWPAADSARTVDA
jgi:biotin operon repressor